MRTFIATRHVDLALVVLVLLLVFPVTEGVAHTSGDHSEAEDVDEQHHGAASDDGAELCGSSTTGASGFQDVAYGSIHATAIRCMAGYGIIQGRSDGSFLPNGDLTRGQMATLLARFVRSSTPELNANSSHDAHQSEMTFHDAADTVHRDGIAVLVGLRVTTGVSETLFEPLGFVTREQLASFLYRTFRSLEVEFADNYPSAFQDVSPSSVHAQAIDALAADGILSGTSSSTFEPRRPVTRAQTATLLHRSAERLRQAGRWSSPWPGGNGGIWHDPATWPDGRVPTASDDVIVEGHVVVAGMAHANSVTVASGSTLEFDTTTATKLEVSGNVVVEGTLRMRPSSAPIQHTLRFVDIDEGTFIGGDHEVLDSDVGLWFTGHGKADIAGSDRHPWSRAATSLPKGDTQLELEDTPAGWHKGDEILITPTSPPGTQGHATGYSTGRVTSISGSTVQLDTPFAYDHPRVAGKWGAEVMNMTRNVRIEGTPAGRAHVMFARTRSPQNIRNASLRYMGPRQYTDDTYISGGQRHAITEGVHGRYPLHFHHNGAGSVGSLVENVVVRDSGHRAFVAHASDGVTFRGTIAHDVFEAAYWWDGTVGGECCGRNWIWDPPSNQIAYDHAIASLIRTDPTFRGFNLAGFELGHGSDLSVTDSVAVGVQGNKNASGFFWPGPNSETENAWRFQNNVSHNNRVHGFHVWANTGEHHLIESSVLYHNGENGIGHGAYTNRYKYAGLTLYGNNRSGVDLHAQGEIHFTDFVFDGGGISRYGFTTGRHRQDRAGALLLNPTFTGYTEHAVSFRSQDVSNLDIVNPTFSGPEETWFHLHDDAHPDSVIRVQLSNGDAFRLYPTSSDAGTLVPAWNARKATIDPFG